MTARDAMSYPLHLPAPVRQAMLAHARAALPNECCGLLIGHFEAATGIVTDTIPLVNAAASPVEYFAEPRSLLAAFRILRERNLDLLAVYHSHPATEPRPSRKDLSDWQYPDQMMLILGLQNKPALKGWFVRNSKVQEGVIVDV